MNKLTTFKPCETANVINHAITDYNNSANYIVEEIKNLNTTTLSEETWKILKTVYSMRWNTLYTIIENGMKPHYEEYLILLNLYDLIEKNVDIHILIYNQNINPALTYDQNNFTKLKVNANLLELLEIQLKKMIEIIDVDLTKAIAYYNTKNNKERALCVTFKNIIELVDYLNELRLEFKNKLNLLKAL